MSLRLHRATRLTTRYLYAAMSSLPHTSPAPSSPSGEARPDSHPQAPQHDVPADTTSAPAINNRALPAPDHADATATTKLDVSGGGSSVKLDHLGPLVVNVDGTMSRIGNWAQLAPIEKENALRILASRNKLRLEALRKKKQQQEEEEKGGD